jgi:hypothetical protein
MASLSDDTINCFNNCRHRLWQWGDINVDVVLLHPNLTDVTQRLNDSSVKNLPFDGMFSQCVEPLLAAGMTDDDVMSWLCPETAVPGSAKCFSRSQT